MYCIASIMWGNEARARCQMVSKAAGRFGIVTVVCGLVRRHLIKLNAKCRPKLLN
jgi:hypothetical protein